MSPALLTTSPTADPLTVLSGYERILSGYRHHDFPDLSSRRFPPDTLHLISRPLDQNAHPDIVAPFATTVAAVGRVLGAYCGSQDVLLGIADGQDGRLLPVRVAWSDDQTWEDVVAGIAEPLTDSHWPRIHPNLLRRALDLTPKQSPVLAIVAAGASHHFLPHDHISLVIVVDVDNAVLSITSSERSCHPYQAKLLASQITALFRHASANPKSAIVLLPRLSSNLISSHEKHSIADRRDAYYPVPKVEVATQYLTIQATARPDSVAVRWYSEISTDIPISSYSPETITNVELEHKSNQLGRWLLRIGLQRGRSVAVCMKRDIWFHIAFIGILRAGGCYVPIDSELPNERQQYIANDADVQYILSTSDMPCFSSLGNVAIDVLDRAVQEAIEGQSFDALPPPKVDDVSYILYTSGTTGTPKGCVLTHRGLSEAILALSRFCASADLDPSGRVNYLSIASVAFDVHIAEIMVALAVGIPILSAPRSLLLEDLPYYIKHLSISHVGIVPSLIEATMGVVQSDEDSGCMTTLRYIASGGEKMSDAILDKWADHPKVRLANFYGPSEVTIGCAGRMMDKDTPKANIGRAFETVSAYVVDEDMNIVLRGGTGELVVEGSLVGRGYVNRPDLTQRTFIKFPDDGTDRWAYRTGDFVRMMADGSLEIIGRIDTQIKLRGVRIESEGISTILRSAAEPVHKLDVMTILAKHPVIGVDQLVSFIAWSDTVPVAVRKGGKPSLTASPAGLLQDLRRACDRELASYMRPSHIIPLNFIPLSSNGKADAKVLAAFFLGLAVELLTTLMSGKRPKTNVDEEYDDPTELEKQVLALLDPYIKLPIDRVGPLTNLFECGMDSLAVARFAADLRRVFHVTPSPVQIMQVPVVREISALLVGESATAVPGNASSTVEQFIATMQEEVEAAFPSDSVEGLLPPFPVQVGVLYRSANSPTMYVQHVMLQLTSDVSVPKMQNTWRELVSQTEILRTVFHLGSELVQVVLRPEACSPRFLDKTISALDHPNFRRYFMDQETSPIATELNVEISRIPPVRLSFFVHSHASYPTTYMVLSIHHSLYDGISLPVLLQDLQRLYTHRAALPSVPLCSILNCITTVSRDAARSFWTSYLRGFPWERLLNRTASSSTADVASIALTRPLSELQSLAAQQHVTLQALFMSAYGSLLARYLYSHDDVVFGVIRAGRSVPVDHIETTICPMITVVPARVRLTDPSKVMQSVQQDIARVSEYEHIPLGRIQKWVTERDGSLFDTLFSVSYKEKGTNQLWSVLETLNPEPDFILAVEVVLDSELDSAAVYAAFTTADVSAETIDNILSNFEETAIRMAEGNGNVVPLSHPNGDRVPSVPVIPSGLEDVDDVTDVDHDCISKISSVASQFLRIDPDFVKTDTSLLSLGLDSIKSVGLSRKLWNEGLHLSSTDIMRLSTPLRLAALVQRARPPTRDEYCLSGSTFATECSMLKNALDIHAIRFSDDDEVRVFPSSALQAGMLSQTITSSGRLYVHLFPLRLARDIDIDRLRESWKVAISSLDILRTSFHFLPAHGSWAQVVHSSPPFQWIDSQHHVEASCDTFTSSLGTTDNSEIEAFRYPPIVLRFVRGAAPDEAHRLILVMHHALYDGLSITKLFHLVEELYRGSELPAITHFHQLLPHLLWQEQHGTSFWGERLRDLHHTSIPRRRPVSADADVHQISMSVQISEEEIIRACRHLQVTSQCIGQAAFAKLLTVLTRSRDIIFGRVVSGRDVPGAEDVIGPILNTVPCRVVFSDSVQNKDLLKQIHDANIASMTWQHASLRSIQRELRIAELWDSLFVFQPRQGLLESQECAPWSFDVGDADLEDISVQYPLNFELHETERGFVVKAACKSDFTSTIELRSLIERYATLLCDIVRFPNERWSARLPEIPPEVPSRTDEITVTIPLTKQSDRPNWDNDSYPFRELLSTTTKVASSNIHVDTHLATLGIDSITAVQIVAKARRIGLRLTAAEIVQSRTVGDLLTKIRDIKVPTPSVFVNTVPIPVEVPRARWAALLPCQVVDEVERVLRASAGMEWMVGMWQKSRGSQFQHVFGYRLPTGVEPSRLESAWKGLVSRHSILRSTFVYDPEEGVPRVVIFKPETLASLWSQETFTFPDDPFAIVEWRMKEMVSYPPPPDRPLTRAVFLQSSEARFLLIHLHHFQYDAWSLQLLADDLSRTYMGEKPRSSNDLDSLLRFAWIGSEAKGEQAKYWETAISTRASGMFPSICNGRATQDRSVYTDTAALSGAADLDKRARKLAVSLQSVFLACWAQVQAKHTATSDATFFLWQSGRTGELKDADRLAVPCINALPFSVVAANTGDILSLAKRVQEDLQARTPVVEQSQLTKVHEWANLGDDPVSNVFVNIVKIAPDIEKKPDALLVPLDVPYYIPEAPSNAAASVKPMRVTDLLQDDIMIDIIVMQETDQVLMSMEFATTILDDDGAKGLLGEWGTLVKVALYEEI